MGYWSEHPMAGDTPQDMSYELLNKYNDEDNDLYHFDLEPSELRAAIEKDFEELLEEAERTENWTFPWICLDWGVAVPESMVPRVVALIYDGGSFDRGYTDEESVSPASYANKLRDNFDKYLKDNDSYQEDMKAPGLIGTMMDAIENQQVGLVNIN